MTQEILSLLGALLVIVLVLGGSYFFTRWAGTHLNGGLLPRGGGSRMRILDRISIGRDQQLLVVQAGGRYLLLGSSADRLTLLTELTAEEGAQWQIPPSDASQNRKAPDFGALLQKLREKNTDEKR
ncbi:MAG: flagellar biosynthetic protein FliO [Oscillospiraceae bacterium]|jgi:flagellar biosynthetic protein FliO|nr:flagellar biosynthetic protein FliO [Oscillospiraceae bacterium]